jgi:GR25 family glycosyltransferase involved in LPS biosynthesis
MNETYPTVCVITTRTGSERQKEFSTRHPFLDFEWFDAVTPEDFSTDDLLKQNLIKSPLNWKLTSIANALSHRALWEKSIVSNQNLMILEDDSVIVGDFFMTLTPLLEEIGDDFDIFLLGFNWDQFLYLEMFPDKSGLVKIKFNQPELQKEINNIGHKTVRGHAYKLRSAFGNCGYIISPKGAALMIQSIFPLEERLVKLDDVDYEFYAQSKDALMCTLYGESESYVAFPPLVYVANNHNESLIQNGS